jgi:hypothetical protein
LGTPLKSALLEHDPEKWTPVFGKDHAQKKKWSMAPIQRNGIMIQTAHQ